MGAEERATAMAAGRPWRTQEIQGSRAMPWMLVCTLFCLTLPLGGAKRSHKNDGASAASVIRLAEKGDHVALERHLQAGTSASTLDREGTLLTHAAAAGHVETIAVILKYGGTDRATIDRQVRSRVSARSSFFDNGSLIASSCGAGRRQHWAIGAARRRQERPHGRSPAPVRPRCRARATRS